MMKLSQKRAISYAISKSNKMKQTKFLLSNGLYEEFENSRYKTMTWFLKSKGYKHLDWEGK